MNEVINAVNVENVLLAQVIYRGIGKYTLEKSNSTTECGKCFRYKQSLKAHMQTHSGEK